MKRGSVLLLFVICLLIFACEKKTTIKIGYMGPLTGRLSDLGISGRNGAQLAIDHANQQLKEQKIELQLIAKDDRQDVEACLEVGQELVDEGVRAVIGPMTSDMSLAVLPLFEENGVTIISPTASTPKLTGLDDRFLRVNPPDRTEALSLAKYAAEELNLSHIVVFYDISNKSFSEGLYKTFDAALQQMGEIQVSAAPYLSDESVNFSELVAESLQKETDGVFLIASSLDSAQISQQVRKGFPDIAILATGWAMTDDFIQHGGKYVERAIFSHYHNNNSKAPAYIAFVKDYEEHFGNRPDFIAALSYNAARVIVEALEKNRDMDKIKETILQIGTFPALQGELKLDNAGDAYLERHYISIANGEYVDL